jgi:hypothetical protein
MSEWTTRLKPELSRRYGVNEIHEVCFEPNGWPGKGPVIGLGIPECELQFCFIGADSEPVAIVNRQRRNKGIRGWLRFVGKMATQQRLFVMLACDTAEQAERAAKMVAKWLPLHRRVALERMYDANSRARDKLV